MMMMRHALHRHLTASSVVGARCASSAREGPGERALLRFLERYRDLEKEGVPSGAAARESAAGHGSGAAALELGPLRRLLSGLSDPQRTALTAHVGGTKGKGSTAAMLSAGLRAAGARVGTYGSPHVRSIRERICVDGVPISDDAVGALVDGWAPRIERAAAAAGEALTHFEVLTALAFVHFSEAGCAWSVLEVGLGGARDATNVVDAGHTLLAVVTNVGEEHLAALGGSIASIARAKAGIAKPARPLVLGPAAGFGGGSAAIIRGIAGGMKCPVFDATDVRVDPLGDARLLPHGGAGAGGAAARQRWAVSVPAGAAGRLELAVDSGCLGTFQRMNAATAVAAMAVLGRAHAADVCPVPDPDGDAGGFGAVVRAAMAPANLTGRLQVVPLRGVRGAACVLDGAHTAAAAGALADSVAELFPGARRVIFVVAMASDKDHEGVFSALLRRRRPGAVICCGAEIAGGSARSTPADALRAACLRARGGAGVEVYGDPHETVESGLRRAAALLRAGADGDGDGLVVVTGSLHAVGAALDSSQLVYLQ